MPYGLYLSAAGAHAQSHRMQVLSHNLANVDTPGFKPQQTILQARFAELIEQGDYAGRMNRVQMESLVALESMKWALGRHTVLGEAFRLAPDPRVRRVSQN